MSFEWQDPRLSIQRLSRHIQLTNDPADVTESQRNVLSTLDLYGPQSLNSLSHHERVTAPTMSRAVNSLALAGLVTRVTAKDDSRKLRIELTPKGRQMVRSARQQRNAWFAEKLAALPAEQQELLKEVTPILQSLAND
ncbi:MarR family winged helix-turn-helix transcriptional regulator [Paracoccus jeotgali]|uniref:MarR family winged helix-turn-helix transcriptional regulator n=1 Tax=Paracoccus jeotgali TaxID=2065379 RepID=UPI0028A7C431|nr:MarR family winged helix-turn-helix transcriptional regulator [Paracoccus jeotgali]